jgi:hemolysin activation/secretion protein
VLEWVNRSQRYVLALRSTFSVGFYSFGATRFDPRSFTGTTSGAAAAGIDPEVPDSKFFTWLGQGQYVRRIFETATPGSEPKGSLRLLRESLLVLRTNVQLSDEPLLALEQFSLGGAQSVRGYRENQLLRDNGIFASAELRVPLWLAADKSPVVALAPFLDYGVGWNVNKIETQSRDIYSAGVGLLIHATQHAQVSVYWGHPFINLHNGRTSLQDDGWHITVSLNAF